MSTLQTFRRHRKPLAGALAALMAVWQIGQPLQGADLYWDSDTSDVGNNIDGTNLGGAGTWDALTTANWWNPLSPTPDVAWPNTSSDRAIFTRSSTAPVSAAVTVDAGGVTANQLRFNRSGFTLSGGDILLAGAAPSLYAQFGETGALSNTITGTAGLTKLGGGAVRLTGANTYTGVTGIAGGSLIITNGSALGSDPSAISVTAGNGVPSNTQTIGFTGGSLVLDGTAGGFTLSRNINLEGRGPTGGSSAPLISLGSNTLSGTLNTNFSSDTPTTFRGVRLNSVGGTLTLSGTVNVPGVIATNITSLGGTNQAGVGDYNLTGALTGSGTLEKSGGGTLFLNPSSMSGFSGALRMSASVTTNQSTVRITSPLVLGTNTGTGANSVVDLNGGLLEVRMNAPTLQQGSTPAAANVYGRSTGTTQSTLFVGHAPGGATVNGNLALGQFGFAAQTNTAFTSRDGYGISFTTAPVVTGDNDASITNSLSGTLSFTGNFWSNTNTTSRTMTIAGNGNTTISGNFVASATGTAANHNLTKTGTGVLTISSTGSTLDGNLNVNGGAVALTDFRSLNLHTAAGTANSSTSINIGTSGTTGNLIIGTATAATAAGLTTSKILNLAGTAGGAGLYANQAGANPVLFNATTMSVNGTANKALTLGGTNTAANFIAAGVPAMGNGGLTKNGPGTWVLGGANAYIGATTIQNGTLRLNATAAASDSVLSTATNTVVFSADTVTQTAGGTLQFTGFLDSATTEELGVLTPSAGAAKVLATASGTAGTTALTFTGLGTRGAGATIDYRPGAGATISISGTSAVVTNGILGAASTSAFQTFNGVDWATITGTAGLVSAFTGYTTTLPLSGTAGATINYATSTSTATTGTASINTLKLIGINGTAGPANTLTLGGALTLTARAVLFDGSAGSGVITGSQLGANATEVHLITNSGTANTTLTVSSTIGGTTGSLTKSGSGTLVVGGNNTFTGNVIINEGTVRLSGTAATLGVNTTAANITTVRQGATLAANFEAGRTVLNVGALQGAGTITNGGTAGTISLGGTGSTGTTIFSGVIQDGGSGPLSVTVNGTTARTQAFLGQSTYTGVTTIGTGAQLTVPTLAIGGTASGIGSSTNAASNLILSGSLIYQGNNRVGSLNLGSNSATTDRLFTLAGTSATLSSTVSNGNSVVWSSTGTIVHATDVNRSLTLGGTSTGDNTFNPQLTNPATTVLSLNKTGAGQWNLGNSNNTYTGSTTINEGILGLNDNGALPAGSPLVLNPTSATSAAILQMSGTFTAGLALTPLTGTGSISWTGSTVSTTGGAGFAALSTPLTVAIGGTASPSALTWGSGGFVGTTAVQNLVLGSTTALSNVDFRNAINLGGSVRTVTVLDNTSTGADYATLSGVLSGTGTGGLRKIGGGILQVTGANTYTGVTSNEAGVLAVRSLGNSTDAPSTPTSVGVSGVTMDNSNAITLGNGTTTGGILQYTGAGETSDRKIRLNTTTGANQIHADGSGPLILTNVDTNMVAGAKTLNLRGNNTQGNMIAGVIANSGTGAVSVTVDGAATWILTNNLNSYSGTTTVSSGALGLGGDTVLGAGTLLNSNGNIFAYGADRVISNALTMNNNSSTGFLGDYSLTFNGANSIGVSGATQNTNTYNSIVSGKALTFNGLTANSLPNNTRTWTLDGPGETVVNGNFTTTVTGTGLAITKNGNGTLTLGTSGTGSNWNQAGRAIDIDRGVLKFTVDNAVPSGVGFGGLILSPETATLDTATLQLNGTTQTFNAFTANTDGSSIIDNSSASPATLSVGGDNATVVFGTGGVGTYSITQSGGGAINLTKTGTGNANFTGALGNTGTVTGNGGVLNINSVSVATGAVADGGTVNFKSGFTTPANLTTVTTDNGGLVSFADGVGTPFTNLATLNLSLTANAALELDAGDSGTDTLTAITAAVGNVTTLFIKDVDLSNLTTYDLILNAGGGLGTSANYSLSLAGYTGSTLSVSSTAVRLNVGTLNLTDMYWAGATTPATTAWNTVDGLGNTNFSDDVGGTVLATALPGKGQKVIFQADNITGGAPLETTLEQAFTVGSLEFRPSATAANTSRTISIAPGAVSSNSLTIRGSDGINLTAGASGSVTISAPLVAAVDQTWTVADAPVELLAVTSSAGQPTLTVSSTAGLTPGMALTGSGIPAGTTIVSMTPTTITMSGTATATTTGTSMLINQQLNVTGALTGSGDVTKAGAGTVVLSGANGNLTGAYINSNGRTLVNTLSALGGEVGDPGSGTDIIVTGGAFLYNNGTAGTFVNDITLNGGTLSAGGAAHTYSGGINVTADSIINMRDLATSTTFGITSRAITLSGVVTGSSAIQVDSITTLTGGNAITGNLVFNNAASTWNGDLNMTRGKVFFQNVAAGGNLTPYVGYNGVINFNQFGAVEYRNIDGGTLNRTAAINFASSAVGELVVNNLDVLASNYTLTQSGLISLNGTSVARINLADAASNLIISGGINLNGNASFSVAGGDADSLVTITGTGFTGTGNLAINDEQGVWNVTSSRLQIDAASTFTGNTTLNEGILILGNKDALSTGSLTITGASTIQASVGLTDANSVANVLNLGNTLTTSGTNSLEFSGGVNNSVDANRTLTNNIASPALLTLSGSALNLVSVASTSARTFTLSGTGSTTISAGIADGNANANALTVTSSGTTTLSGANTYNGTTTMSQATGILRLQGSNTGTGGTTLTAGTLQLDSASNGGLASGTLTLTAGTLTAASTARTFSNNTLLTAVTLAGDQSITLTGTVTNNAGNRTLTNNLTSPAVGTLAGNVFLSEGGSARTLTISGTGDTNITGLIANSSTGAGAAGVLAKSGLGTLTLSSTGNSYTGGTTINLGTVRTGASNVIPNTGTVTVNATSAGNAILDLNGNSDTIGALTLGGVGGTAGSINSVATGAGTLTLGGNVTVTTTGNWTTPALISGTLALGGTSRTFTVNDSTGTDVDLDLQATVTGIAGNSVTKAGAGVLLMTSTGGNWGGGTVVSAGEIRLGASNVIPNTGTVTLNGGGSSILNLNGFNDTIAALTLGGTGNGAGSVYQVNTGAGTLTLGGTVTVNSTTNNTGSVISGNIALGASRTFAISNSPAEVDLDLQATVTGTATQSFTKSGNGVLAISSTANNWGGGTVVSAGELRSGNSNVIPDTGTVTLSGSGSSVLNLNGFSDTIGALTLGGTGNAAGSAYEVNTGAGILTLGGTVTVTSTGNSTTAPLISGNVELGATRTFDISNSTGSIVDLNVTAVISGSTFGLTKTGLGTLSLGGENTYSGATTVNNGTLLYGINAAIASDSAVTVNANGAGLTATLDLNGFDGALSSLTLGGVGQTATSTAIVQTGAGTLTLNGGLNYNATGNPGTAALVTGQLALPETRTFTVADSSGSLVDLDVQAVVSGAGGINKAGPGALLLSGTNTYSGKTTITNGALAITVVSSTPGADQSLGTHSDVDLGVAGTSSGTLVYAAPGAGALGKNINALGNGSDTILNLGGALTLSGTLTKNGTTLTLSGSSSGILVTGTIVGSSSASDLVIGGGVVTLNNANTYNGPTFLSAGATLNINNANAISDGALNINGGTIDNTSGAAITLATNNPLNINSDLTFTGSNSLNLGTGAVTLNANRTVTVSANTLTIGGVISGGFSLVGAGNGTLTLTGASDYTGTTTAQPGTTLNVGDGSLGDTSSGTTVESGASLVLNGVTYTAPEPLTISGTGAGGVGGAFATTGTSSFAGPITAASNATINASGTLSLTGGLVKNGTTLTLAGGGTITISGTGISGADANSDLVVDGAIVNLDVASSYNGPTSILNGGVINANVADALPTSNGRTAVTMDASGSGGSNLTLGFDQSVASLTGAASSTVNLNGNTLTIGTASGSTTFAGNISGTGGALTKDGASTLELSGNNSYTGGSSLNGGVVQVSSANALGSTGTISFAGGTLQYTAANTADYSARFSTVASQAISIDTNGQNVIFASNLTSSGGSLAKTGAGTLELTGANTYDLGTTVGAGGALLINNTTGSATGTGNVTTPTLGGSGSIVSSATSASVVVQNILNIGNSGDTGGQDLVIDLTGGSSSINLSGAALNFDLWTDFTSGSSNAFPASDLLNLNAGTIDITGGTLNVSALANIGNTWAHNTAWQLFNWNAVTPTGTFSTLNLPDLTTWDALAEWDTTNLYTTGSIRVNIIPEPSRAMLLLLGLLSLGFRRRRNRF